MKRVLILNLLIVAVVSQSTAQTLWDDYDNPSDLTYGFINGDLNQSFPNSVSDAINSSDTCARYARSIELYDVLIIEPNSLILDLPNLVNGTNKMSMKVWSTSPGDTIQITLESKTLALPGNYPTGRHSVYIYETDSTNAWENIEFNYVERPDGAMADSEVDRLVLLFAPNTTTAKVFLFDSLVGPTLGDDPCDTVTLNTAVLEDFDCQRNMTYDFVNGENAAVINPLQSGINLSEKCGKIKKWPNGDGAFGGKLDNSFTTNDFKTVHVSLYDQAAPSDYLIILRDANDSTFYEATLTTSSDSTWEEFDMDISSIPANITIEGWVMLINPGTVPEDSIYYDNFRVSNEVVTDLCTGVVLDPSVLEDFDCQRNMSFDFVNGDNSVVTNPNMSTLNMSSNCGMIKKWIDPDLNDTINVPNDGAFGGALNNPFTSADYKTIHISLLAPIDSSDFIIIVRDGDDVTLAEKTFTTTSITEWEEFKMDLSSIPTTTSMEGWVLLVNPGTNTADSIFYDDFRLSNDSVPNTINVNTSNKVSIYPNPVKDVINVSVSNHKIRTLMIYSIDGMLISELNSNSTLVSYNVSDLQKGVYIISLKLETGEILNQKFIK